MGNLFNMREKVITGMGNLFNMREKVITGMGDLFNMRERRSLQEWGTYLT